MTTYYMEFVNDSEDWWHFGVYQEYPDGAGLDSVVWQEQGVPNEGGKAIIHWEMDYGVSITDFIRDNVQASQTVPAQLGNTYQVIIRDNITGIDPTPISTGGNPSIVTLKNNTSPAKSIDMGFALSEKLIAAQPSVGGQQSSNYQVHPVYWVALFRNVKVGDLVTSNVTVAPIAVEYTQGNTRAKITAFMDSGNTLTKVEFFP